MKRYPALVALLGLALAGSMLLAVEAASQVPNGPVYAIAKVQAELVDQPQDWAKRTVGVHGMVEPCPWWGAPARLWHCADDALILVGDPTDPVAEPLPLSRLPANGILAVLYRLPFLHGLAAPSRAVPMFTPARFWVQVRSLAAQSCGGRTPCYEAVLLGAAPAAS
jgi:hypothetical protein